MCLCIFVWENCLALESTCSFPNWYSLTESRTLARTPRSVSTRAPVRVNHQRSGDPPLAIQADTVLKGISVWPSTDTHTHMVYTVSSKTKDTAMERPKFFFVELVNWAGFTFCMTLARRINLSWCAYLLYLDMRFSRCGGRRSLWTKSQSKSPAWETTSIKTWLGTDTVFFPVVCARMNEQESGFNEIPLPFHLSARRLLPVCHNSRALLSRDVKTLSCGEWQQLGHQRLTF